VLQKTRCSKIRTKTRMIPMWKETWMTWDIDLRIDRMNMNLMKFVFITRSDGHTSTFSNFVVEVWEMQVTLSMSPMKPSSSHIGLSRLVFYPGGQLNPSYVTYEVSFMSSYRLSQDLCFRLIGIVRPFMRRPSSCLAVPLELKVWERLLDCL